MIKNVMAEGSTEIKLSPGQHLLAAAEAGALTAMITNPIWVVKTRMIVQNPDSPSSYRGLFGVFQ